MWTSARRLFGEGGWILAGQLIALVGGVAGIRIVTGVVPPAIYGEAALFLGVVTLASDLFCAPILHGVLRFLPDASGAGRVRSFRGLAGRLLRRRALLAGASILCGGSVWAAFAGRLDALPAFAAGSALLALNTWRLFEIGLLNASREHRRFALWNAVDAWLRPLGALVVVLALGPSSAAVLAGWAFGAAASNASFRWSVIRGAVEGAPDPDRSATFRREILQFAAPLPPLAILGWLMNLSDRYILAGLAGSEAAGIYVAAYGLASRPLLAFATVVNLTMRPLLFEAISRDEAGRQRRMFLLWLGLVSAGTLAGVLLIAWWSDLITRLALAPEFSGAAPLLPWIAGAYAFQGIRQPFEGLIFGDRRTRIFTWLHGTTAVVAVALYLLLIPRQGALGAARATLVALAVSCLLTAAVSRAGRLWGTGEGSQASRR